MAQPKRKQTSPTGSTSADRRSRLASYEVDRKRGQQRRTMRMFVVCGVPKTPPASGAHYASPAPLTKHFYTMKDRPAVETLFHNLEHGYTIAWYRDSITADQSSLLKQISGKFTGGDNDDKFIAAPWSASDGAGFTKGTNIVLAHWSANASDPTNTSLQKGVRQSCGLVSGEAVQGFMTQFPAASSPEANGA